MSFATHTVANLRHVGAGGAARRGAPTPDPGEAAGAVAATLR